MNTPIAPVSPRLTLLACALSSLLPIGAFAQTVSAPAPIATTKAAAAEDALQLTTFTVTDDRDAGYESMFTTSGMRTVQELKNVANSISIIHSQFIEDIGATSVEEMSKYFVTGEQNPDPALPDKGVFRGLVNTYNVRNGWIWYSPMDSYTTDRVELLRGPNAFLYGEADLGGASNQITKRGLFTRNLNRAKLMVSSFELLRGEIDFNRIIVPKKLAVRFSGVQSTTKSWIDYVRRELRGLYGAATYRPFEKTTVSVMWEHTNSTSVNSQGLFIDSFSRPGTAVVAAAGGYIYIPKTGALFRSQGTGRVNSTGTGLTIVDPAIVPKTWQLNGPNATAKDYFDQVNIEIEQHIGKNLHLLFAGNFYDRHTDAWTAAGSPRNVFRDRNATLPGGAPNPYFNELYTEYFRARQWHGNIVKDMRFSAVYDLNLKWMKQQIVFNAQQHQDNPRHWYPNWGEYLDPKNPAFVGAINPQPATTAEYTANRTTFTNNRFMRRFYLKDGNGAHLTGELGPIPGVSAWYPDLGNSVPAGGEQTYRRFYTPSVGVGASGSYFKNHLYTLVGYRRDHFNMKTRFGAPRPIQGYSWTVDELPSLNTANPFVHYAVDGANYGAVLRFNEAFAVAYNHAQSFRISVGEGGNTYVVNEDGTLIKQGIPVGEGDELSARGSLLKGRIEMTLTHYKNYTPNARFSPPSVSGLMLDELQAIFPTTFLRTGTDYQTTTTKGYEFEVVANLTRRWRLSANAATNKVVNEKRIPLLKSFQAEAKEMGRPTPLLDAYITTLPEGVPNAGYTKIRANLFTRYEFSQGWLKGVSIGGGTNYRTKTFRGNFDLNQDGVAEELYSPAYYILNLYASYTTRIANRRTSFAINADNVLDKDYYRSGGTASGSWGDPASFKLTMITEF